MSVGGRRVRGTRLPIEIQEHIIDYLVDDHASLRNCVLTCRAWMARSRYHLLRAIRITARSTWEAVVDHFQANPGTKPLARSLATAPATPTECTQLLGTYPALLFKDLPNLRRWEIRAPADTPDDPPPKLFFHQTTLTQLRLSPITELHLSSIQFPSQTDFVRLLSSIPRLRILECSEIRFTGAESISSTTRSPILRRPLCLETLQIQGKRADEDVLTCLLSLTASSLQNLVVRRREGSKRTDSKAPSPLVLGNEPPPASTASDTPAMSQLRSLTLHVDQEPDDSMATLFLETFQEAAKCVRAFRDGSRLGALGIHIHMNDTCKNPTTPCDDPVSLALLLLEDRIQSGCEVLEARLLEERDLHLTVMIYIPPSWARREVVLRSLRENAFPKLDEKGLLSVGYSGGDSYKSYAPHNGPVSTLAVSPDGRWITSRSRKLALIWDARTRSSVHEWVIAVDQPSSEDSFAFSPDSKSLACSVCAKGRALVEIRSVQDGRKVRVLEGCENGAESSSQLMCAWFHEKLVFVSLTRSKITVQSWDAHTFQLSSTRKYEAPFERGSLLLSPDGRLLVGLTVTGRATRRPYTSKKPANPPPRPRVATPPQPRPHGPTCAHSSVVNHPLCVVWDIDSYGPGDVLLKGLDHERVLAASFDQNGRRLALSMADHAVHIWYTVTRQLLTMAEPMSIQLETPRFQKNPYRYPFPQRSPELLLKAVAFLPGYQRIVRSLRHMRNCEGQMETLLAVDWDTFSGRPLLSTHEHLPPGACSGSGLAQFSPAGTHIAFTSMNTKIHVCDLSSGLLPNLLTFGGCPGDRPRRFGLRSDHYDVTKLLFSPDGQTLCWATKGGEVEIRSLRV